ncbi:MAG TPA: cell division protein ZapD [Gammaproteobacteria bacterium]|nr:cell division protein ZapD [Gammaproteobacteria bacterium]
MRSTVSEREQEAAATESIIYEQPLTERVRTFLRLKFLLSQTEQYARSESAWDSRTAIAALLDIADMLTRGNARGEALKELDSQIGVLALLRDNPDVDNPRLLGVLRQLERLKAELSDRKGPAGQRLRDNEFLSAIKHRSAIPGGTCEFDLPGYHFWLSQPTERRATDIDAWLKELAPLHEAISVLLDLNRQSADAVPQVAEDGVFQYDMRNQSNCQLIRVLLPAASKVFPEISGGRHRVTIRFFDRPDINARPRQVDYDVDFDLMLCHL